MLATSADPRAGLPMDGTRWAYEVKWDGMRVLADVRDGAVRLTSRAGNDVTAAWPELAALGEVHPDVLLDGEVVVLRRGIPSFGALAERMHVRDRRRAAAYAASAPATFIAFDVLRLYGVDLTGRTWQERREALERLEPSGRAWQLSPVYDDAEVLLAATLEQGLEGVVAKRRASRYVPGGRNGDWVKLPHRRVQACVVGGWRPETDDARRIGSLLLGVWDPAGGPDGGTGGSTARQGEHGRQHGRRPGRRPGRRAAAAVRRQGRLGARDGLAGGRRGRARAARARRRPRSVPMCRGSRRPGRTGSSRGSSPRSGTSAAARTAGCGSRCSAGSAPISTPTTSSRSPDQTTRPPRLLASQTHLLGRTR